MSIKYANTTDARFIYLPVGNELMNHYIIINKSFDSFIYAAITTYFESDNNHYKSLPKKEILDLEFMPILMVINI